MKKLWHDRAWEEYLSWQGRDRKTIRRINQLLTSIERNAVHASESPNRLGDIGQDGGASALTTRTESSSGLCPTASRSPLVPDITVTALPNGKVRKDG